MTRNQQCLGPEKHYIYLDKGNLYSRFKQKSKMKSDYNQNIKEKDITSINQK